ncbi:probable short-chain dehydrogenase (plasmid) [Rhodococcus jostii RHA1]|uniref:Probable short-chain dehydrogenase n=1 Tax=Rhodococcus jostii (strain RHA1) TaxID=101510 RepID=Q0RW21_RHOJR|nr:SDR family NAD(P)-dependent oxidoreductase [Rhodococcus jostii]ABH00515.1 probable short-chain dehydrogenase [Rhodococcus jostii RHA1]
MNRPSAAKPLIGRVALVTGGGRGLGRAHSRELARLGASVVVADTGVALDGTAPDATVATSTVDEICADGGRAVADHADVRTFAGAQAAVTSAVECFGRLDIVVNNAGTLHGAPLEALTEADLRAELDIHAVATVAVLQAAFPVMRAQRYGRVLNTISEASLHRHMADSIAYSTAKAAVWGATMAAAAAGEPDGITVNALSPGAYTRMSKRFLDVQGIPAGLDLSPERVAEVAAGLCTEAAGGINGRVLHTAGGHIREFRLGRLDDTDLVEWLRRYVDRHVAGAPND